MQTEKIIEKAEKLGLDTGSSSSMADNLRHIAEQVGINDFNSISDVDKLEQILDEKISSQNINDNINASDVQQNEIPIQQNKGRFGEKEYNQAKDKNGSFDKNHYKAKQKELDQKLNDAKKERDTRFTKKDPKDTGAWKADGSDARNKNFKEKVNDRINVAKARQDVISNKLANAKANAYRTMHPGEALKDAAKDKAKGAAKTVGKKAGKAAANTGKAVAKGLKVVGSAILKFIMANPIVLAIIAVVAIVLLIILLIFGSAGDDGDSIGYYDAVCNFNETTVVLKSCNGGSTTSLKLEDYVIGKTYSYQQNNKFSNEGLKALMIIIKTNAFSYGNYSSSKKEITIDDCDLAYTQVGDINTSNLDSLKNLYASIEEQIFISESYQSSLNSLSSINSLPLGQEELSQISNANGSYEQILNQVYNVGIEESGTTEVYRGTMIVGDSRVNWMKLFGVIDDSSSVYAGAMGYSWFVGNTPTNFKSESYNCKINAIDCLESKMGNAPHNIIIWLGANDIYNKEKYYSKYYELAKEKWSNHKIYVFSVGYVDDDRSPYVKNKDIEEFNNYMRAQINSSGLSNLIYVDLGFSIDDIKDKTTDGVHYNKDFSRVIYERMISELGQSSISNRKAIYNLSDYCTYYNITNNTAYWWPIGSSNPTKENIYGSSPTTTAITSTFGPRQIEGVNGNHGAIDIAGACNSTVVIATKSGTITEVNDTCDNNGSYGSTCGSGYGNYVMIEHDDGTSSLYGHLYPKSIRLAVGNHVEQGEKIAMVGNSGSSTGCHLHFEIRLNGVKVDPLEYVSPDNPRPATSYNFVGVGNTENGKQYICKSLLNSGYSENAVIGIMINIKAESGFVAPRLQGDYASDYVQSIEYTKKVDSGEISREDFIYHGPNGGGYGLAQWTAAGRKENLYNFAKQKNKSIGDIGMQLEFLLNEVSTGTSIFYTIPYKYVTGNYSAYEVATNWCDYFEGPSGSEECRSNGNCPSSTCENRAKVNLAEISSYVKNGCQ